MADAGVIGDAMQMVIDLLAYISLASGYLAIAGAVVLALLSVVSMIRCDDLIDDPPLACRWIIVATGLALYCLLAFLVLFVISTGFAWWLR